MAGYALEKLTQYHEEACTRLLIIVCVTKTKNNLYVRKRINAHIVIYSYNGISDSYDNE